MQYKELGNTGIKASSLGFGAMRLPMVKIGNQDFVDIDKAVEVIQYAFAKGVNYIDSGFFYCAKESEIAVGRALRGWRDKVTVTSKATKMCMEQPGDLRRMLEHQLLKLDIDQLDFYCLHGIGWENFNSFDKKSGWFKDLLKAKEEGLCKHIGFSFHDEPENMLKLIDLGVFEMVICQYNYLDQKNANSIAYAAEKGLAVVGMGPVGGGLLAHSPGFLKQASSIDVSSAAKLAIRFVLSNPHIDITISGMGDKQMVDENIAAADAGALVKSEYETLNKLLDKTRNLANLYCTGCKYCMPCPVGVDIPARFAAMNKLKVYGLKEQAISNYQAIKTQEQKSDGKGQCIECGKCEAQCPQNIAIIKQLKETEASLNLIS